jgi:hypothetical protein
MRHIRGAYNMERSKNLINRKTKFFLKNDYNLETPEKPGRFERAFPEETKKVPKKKQKQTKKGDSKKRIYFVCPFCSTTKRLSRAGLFYDREVCRKCGAQPYGKYHNFGGLFRPGIWELNNCPFCKKPECWVQPLNEKQDKFLCNFCGFKGTIKAQPKVEKGWFKI